MLRFRKMTAAIVVVCMMLTLLPMLEIGDLTTGVADASSYTRSDWWNEISNVGPYSSSTTASQTTGDPDSQYTPPSSTAIAAINDAINNAPSASAVADAMEKLGDVLDQALALNDSSTGQDIVDNAKDADDKIASTLSGEGKSVTAEVTPDTANGAPSIIFSSDDVVGLKTAAYVQTSDKNATEFTGKLTYGNVNEDESPIDDLKTRYSNQYDLTGAYEVDIKLLIANADFTGSLNNPIYITVTVPGTFDLNKLAIINWHDGKPYNQPYRIVDLANRKVTFALTQFSPFVFCLSTGTASAGGSSKNTPTPIVPVLYDITKAGDTFSYKVLIANGGGNMSGATVTVRLNDHYKSTVTIGSDGVGNGTLEAPGFAAGVAVFYARINGISNPGVTKPMVVSSSGRVLPR